MSSIIFWVITALGVGIFMAGFREGGHLVTLCIGMLVAGYPALHVTIDKLERVSKKADYYLLSLLTGVISIDLLAIIISISAGLLVKVWFVVTFLYSVGCFTLAVRQKGWKNSSPERKTSK